MKNFFLKSPKGSQNQGKDLSGKRRIVKVKQPSQSKRREGMLFNRDFKMLSIRPSVSSPSKSEIIEKPSSLKETMSFRNGERSLLAVSQTDLVEEVPPRAIHPSQFLLRITGSKEQSEIGRSFLVDTGNFFGNKVMIGRSEDSRIISLDETISRKHCFFEKDKDNQIYLKNCFTVGMGPSDFPTTFVSVGQDGERISSQNKTFETLEITFTLRIGDMTIVLDAEDEYEELSLSPPFEKDKKNLIRFMKVDSDTSLRICSDETSLAFLKYDGESWTLFPFNPEIPYFFVFSLHRILHFEFP